MRWTDLNSWLSSMDIQGITADLHPAQAHVLHLLLAPVLLLLAFLQTLLGHRFKLHDGCSWQKETVWSNHWAERASTIRLHSSAVWGLLFLANVNSHIKIVDFFNLMDLNRKDIRQEFWKLFADSPLQFLILSFFIKGTLKGSGVLCLFYGPEKAFSSSCSYLASWKTSHGGIWLMTWRNHLVELL